MGLQTMLNTQAMTLGLCTDLGQLSWHSKDRLTGSGITISFQMALDCC